MDIRGGLNMYWLWIEVKCRDPGFRHDRGGPVGEESSRDGVEIESKQHDISRRSSNRVVMRSSDLVTSAGASAWHQQQIEQPSCHEIKRPGCHEINQLVVMRSTNLVTWDQATRMFEWIPPSSRSFPSSMQHLYLASQTIYDRCKFLFKSSNIWRTCLYQYTAGWRHQESSVLYVMWTRGW